MKKIFSLLIVLFVLQGCVTKYAEPLEGPRAKIRFVSYTTGPENVTVISHAPGNCRSERAWVATLSGRAVANRRKDLGMPLKEGLNPKSYTENYIKADRPFSFDMFWVRSRTTTTSHGIFSRSRTYEDSCKITQTFNAEKGGLYEAILGDAPMDCWIKVLRIKEDGDGNFLRIPEPTVKEDEVQCGKKK